MSRLTTLTTNGYKMNASINRAITRAARFSAVEILTPSMTKRFAGGNSYLLAINLVIIIKPMPTRMPGIMPPANKAATETSIT